MGSIKTGLLLFAAAVLTLSLVFAWRTVFNQAEEPWNPERLVIDTGRFHRYEPNPPSDKSRGEWMQKLAEQKTAARLPADESILSWDLVDPEFRKNVVLVLRLNAPDRFQRRCLEQFLQSRNVSYVLDEREHFDVRLKTKEEAEAKALIGQLATYDLDASLVVLRETKPY
ncbi:MAG: hypothetical protein AB7E49_05475 [Campylobacterales bacterium]